MSLTLAALANRLDPPPVDVYAVCGYTPTSRQAEFDDATEWDVLYGGAAGGGKTKALLMWALKQCQKYPGIKGAAFRRTYPELEESLLAELEQLGYAHDLGCTYNQSKHDLRFPNGSIIRFRYAETVKDATRRQGSEIQFLIVDERTQVPSTVVEYLATRLRSSDPAIPVLGIRSGSNPGGIGHGAVKKDFITATAYGQHITVDARGRARRFIPAKVADNPHLNPEYELDLADIKDAALRAALKDGSWDTFAGQFFTEWNRARHVVPAFAVPVEWVRLTGMDWGYAAPHCVLWAAVHDRRVWVYRELYDTQVGERDLARRVLTAEGALNDVGDQLSRTPAERIKVRVGDPSMWNKTSEAMPIAQTFAAEGVPMVKAANDRVSGWQRVHTYLGDGPACDWHRRQGDKTCPMLHVLEGAAPNLERTLPDLPHDVLHVEDVDTDAEDHAADALRYLLMHLTIPVTSREAAPPPGDSTERVWAQLERRRRESRNHSVLGAD